MKCPKCGMEINPASIMAYRRLEKMTEKERVKLARYAARVRWRSYRKNKTVLTKIKN